MSVAGFSVKYDLSHFVLTQPGTIWSTDDGSIVLEVSDTPVEGWAGEAVPGLTVRVEASSLPKCPRCWTHSAGIGSDEKHPELCPRCAKAVG